MKVSAVVRAYNEADHLGTLVKGLREQTHAVDEIVVVDSGSTDGTPMLAESLGCRVVPIEKSEFTFGRSLNYGCAAAQGELLLIVSAHVYPVYDSYVAHLVESFKRGQTALAYGRQVGDHRTAFSESRIMEKWFPAESIRSQSHPFCNNANAMVRRSVWEQFRYDESLTGLEDVDLAKRLLEAGHSLDYVAEAPVVHVHEEDWQTIRNRYRREAIAYKKIMHEAEFSAPEAAGLLVANVASDYYHALRDGRLTGNLVGIPKFRLGQFLGAVEGFRTANVSQSLLRRFYYPTDTSRRSPSTDLGRPIEYSQESR